MFGLFRKKKKVVKKESPQVVKTEVKQEENPVVKEAVEVKAVEPKKVEVEETEPKAKPRKMAYHITKHPKGGWQIKKGGAQKALKRFSTQKEAIEYAKEVEKTGASYIIHKADGKTRKKTY